MTARLLVQAEPFEAYSEIPGEVQAESSGDVPASRGSGGRGSYSRRQPQTPRGRLLCSAAHLWRATAVRRAGYGSPYGRLSRWPWRGPVSGPAQRRSTGSTSDGSDSSELGATMPAAIDRTIGARKREESVRPRAGPSGSFKSVRGCQ